MAQVIKEILLDQKKLLNLITESFQEVDEDGSGEIDLIELREFLLKFVSVFTKSTPTKEDIEEIMANYDCHGKGALEFNDFYFLIKDILYAMLEANIPESNVKQS